MKFLLNILLFAFAASTVAHAQLPARSARSAGFAELRAEYARALERIDSAEEKKLDELKRQYAEAIDRGVVHYMRQGDLKSTLALRDERERFEEAGTIPPEVRDSNTGVSPVEPTDPGPQPVSWDDVDDGVIRTIRTCRERWQAINQYAARQRLELNQYYAKQLDPLEKRLTQQGRLDQALAVSKERERVAGEITRLDKLVPDEPEALPSERQPRTSEFGTLAKLPGDLKEQVVAYYSFEDSGTRVRDQTGNGHDGRATYKLNYVPGKAGKAIHFDGDQPLLQFPEGKLARSLDGAEAVSFALWIRPDRVSPKTASEAPIVFSTKNQGAKSGMALIINQSRTVFGGSPADEGGWIGVSARPLTAKAWQHVAGTFDFKRDRLTLYIDGKHTETRAFSAPTKTYTNHGGQKHPDTLGGAAGFQRNFQGAIDELMFFRTALTESDASTLAKMRGE